MAEVKTYELVSAPGRDKPVFTGRAPRQAALKAASRGFASIRLRERGAARSKREGEGKKRRMVRYVRVHVFKGSRKKVARPEGAPSWIPAQVWQPRVAKQGVEWVKA